VNIWKPRLDILPPGQRSFWPKLTEVPHTFVLYGGTAIALRLGHRQSVDFYFFSSPSFEYDRLMRQVHCLADAESLQSEKNTSSVAVDVSGQGRVQVSFFGGLPIGRVGNADRAADNGIAVASLLDLAAAKMAVIQRRAEKKDYLDVAAIMDAGISIETALAAAVAVHGPSFNPALSLKALSYFQDGNLRTLAQSIRERLTEAASEVGELPHVNRVADTLV